MSARITNFGSCCIDNVYQVPHFVAPGETLPCTGYAVFPGGKGLNQSIALARAGADVRHAGRVGHDGEWLRAELESAGADVSLLKVTDAATGHAVIQISPDGENSIVIYGGANQDVNSADVDEVLSTCEPGELLLLQNEISELKAIMDKAKARGLRVAFNAAPMTEEVKALPLETVDYFIVNEIEGKMITGRETPDEIINTMLERFPDSAVVLTLGREGARYADAGQQVSRSGFPADAKDTTGAGDTFTGYLLAGIAAGDPIETCLEAACRAAAICVTRPGAASSIPTRDELD